MEKLKKLCEDHNLFITKQNQIESNFTIFNNTLDTKTNLELLNKSPDNILKILDTKFIESLALLYELENSTPNKIKLNSYQEMRELLIKFFDKFKSTYGYHKLDDTEWSLYEIDNTKYELKENQLIYDNTIIPINKYDKEINNYVNNITNYIKKLSDNILCDYKYIADTENDIINIAIICNYVEKN